MRQLSIRTQVLLALNGTTLALGIAAGWACIHLVNRAAENRAVHEPVHNTARLIGALRLPLTERLAQDIRGLTGCETAFVTGAGSPIVSTLPTLSTATLQAAVPAAGPNRVTLEGRRYVAAVSDIPGSQPAARVLLLAPANALSAEGRRAGWRIAWTTLAVVVLTTGGGVWLAHGVTRSLCRLAAEAARMAARLGAQGGARREYPGHANPLRFAETDAPSEVASLAQSINHLLTRLESAQQDLEQAARLAAVGQVASAVVHELRNPLCGIAMNARILANEVACRGEHDGSLDQIAREVERMDLYLQELLLLARPASGGAAGPVATPGALRGASLRTAISSVAALLSGRCRHAGVEWASRLPDASPTLAIPEADLRQVLLNLALNALDAMPNGGRICVAATGAGEGTLRITVSDSGSGVRVPTGQDIFAPFVTTKPSGSGLGLYVSRQIVERAGGQIGFVPEPPLGTTFWIELPLAAGGTGPDAAVS